MPTKDEIDNGIKVYVADFARDLLPSLSPKDKAKMIKQVKEGKPLFKVLGLKYDEVRGVVTTGLEVAEMKRRLP